MICLANLSNTSIALDGQQGLVTKDGTVSTFLFNLDAADLCEALSLSSEKQTEKCSRLSSSTVPPLTRFDTVLYPRKTFQNGQNNLKS
jgi:hypothetical protein